MFLTIEEIRQSKSRYIAMTLVVLLISFVIFFSAGLAEGLAKGNRFEIERWQAERIELSEASNDNITASFIEKPAVVSDTSARVSTAFATIEAENVALVAFDPGSFIEPVLVEGTQAVDDNQVVMSLGLKEKGFNLGEWIRLDDKEMYQIAGFTEPSTHFLSNIVYMHTDQFQLLKYGVVSDQVSALVQRSGDTGVLVQDVIEAIPGYIPQKLTLNLMIYFLIGISSAIVAIFIYIMTIQKRAIFGVLKAQGTSNAYLRRSVILQSTLISGVAITIGLGLTLILAALLPAVVPFALDLKAMMFYALLLWMASILGSVFSLRTIRNIDPIEAMGGSV